MLKPLEDRVIVKLEEKKDITRGGILLSGSDKNLPCYARVMEVGPGTKDTKMQVEKGQRVVIKNDVGTCIELDNEELVIVSYNDILAIVLE